MIKELEKIIDDKLMGRWVYVNVDGKYNTYLHLDCDVLVGSDGRCLACNNGSPLIWNTTLYK